MALGRITHHPRGVEEFARRLFRTGVVVSVDQKRALARVRFEDQGEPDKQGVRSWDFQVLQRKTHKDKDYWLPDVGEHVVCLQLPFGPSEGFIVGAFYSEEEKPPVEDANKRHVLFDDGTWMEYDRDTHAMRVHCVGNITIESCTKITLVAPEIERREASPC